MALYNKGDLYKSLYGKREPSQQYTPEYNEALEQQVLAKEQDLIAQGQKVKPMQKRSNLDRIFDLLQIGQYAVVGALKNLTDDDPETTALRGIIDGLKAGNFFGPGYERGEAQFKDVLTNLGWEDSDKLSGKIAKGAVGLVGDIVLDPSTYATLGLAPLLKGTGTKVGSKIIKGLTHESAETILREIAELTGKEFVPEITKKLAAKQGINIGGSAIRQTADDLVRRVNKLAGIVVPEAGRVKRGLGIGIGKYRVDLIDEDTLRMLGDKTVAPYFNAFVDKLRNTKLMKAFNSKFKLQELAKTNPELAAKNLLYFDFVGHQYRILDEAQQAIVKIHDAMKEKLTPAEQRQIVELLEDANTFKTVLHTELLRETEVGKKYYNRLSKIRDNLDEALQKYHATHPDAQDLRERYGALVNLRKELEKITSVYNSRGVAAFIDVVDKDIVELHNATLFMSVDEIVDMLRKLPDYKDYTDEQLLAKAQSIRHVNDLKLKDQPDLIKELYEGEEQLREISYRIGKDKPPSSPVDTSVPPVKPIDEGAKIQPIKDASGVSIVPPEDVGPLKKDVAELGNFKRLDDGRYVDLTTGELFDTIEDALAGLKRVDELPLNKDISEIAPFGISKEEYLIKYEGKYVDPITGKQYERLSDWYDDFKNAKQYHEEYIKSIMRPDKLSPSHKTEYFARVQPYVERRIRTPGTPLYEATKRIPKKKILTFEGALALDPQKKREYIAFLAYAVDPDFIKKHGGIHSDALVHDLDNILTLLYLRNKEDVAQQWWTITKKRAELNKYLASMFGPYKNIKSAKVKELRNAELRRMLSLSDEEFEKAIKARKLSTTDVPLTPDEWRDMQKAQERLGYVSDLEAKRITHRPEYVNMQEPDYLDAMDFYSLRDDIMVKHFGEKAVFNELTEAQKKVINDEFVERVQSLIKANEPLDNYTLREYERLIKAPPDVIASSPKLKLKKSAPITEAALTKKHIANLSKKEPYELTFEEYRSVYKDVLERMRSGEASDNLKDIWAKFNGAGYDFDYSKVTKDNIDDLWRQYVSYAVKKGWDVPDNVIRQYQELYGDIQAYGEPRKLYEKIGFDKTYDVYNYKGIPIKSATGMSDKQPSNVESIVRWVDSLPKKVRDWLRTSGVEIRIEDFAVDKADSIYNPGRNLIQVLHGERADMANFIQKVRESFIYSHEVAHAMVHGKRVPKGWAQAVRDDGVEFVSYYAKKAGTPAEDFAESVARYIGDTEKFIKEFPNRAKLIKDYINNLNVDPKKLELIETAARQKKQMPRAIMDDVMEGLEKTRRQYEKIVNDTVTGKITYGKAIEKLDEINKALATDEALYNYIKQYGTDDDIGALTELVHTVLDDAPIPQKVKKAVKWFRKSFDEIGINEVQAGYLDNMLEDYVTHVLNPDYAKHAAKLTGDGGFGKKFNPFNLSRYEFKDEQGNVLRTIKEINDYIYRTSNGKKKNFFLDTIADIWTVRMLKHNELMYDAHFAKQLYALFGKRVKDVADIGEGETIVISVAQLKDALFKKRAGLKPKEVYEALGLADTVLDTFTAPLIKIEPDKWHKISKFIDDIPIYSIPDTIYEHANRIGKIQFDNDSKALLGIYDKFLHLWKLNVTAVIPGFHVRNFIANNFQNYLDLGMEAMNPATQKEALAILRGIDDGFITTRFGQRYSFKDLRNMASDLKVLDAGLFAKDLPLEFSDDAVGSYLRKGSINPLNTEFLPYRFGRAAGNNIENHARLVNFIANIKRGASPQEASEHVMKFLFDYNDVTEFERHFMKRAIPFYTWMRKNIPLQLEQMLTKPNRYRNIAKFFDAVEGLTSKRDRVDKRYIGDFAQDWLQLPLKVKNIEGREEPVFWNPNLPFGDVDRIPSPFSPVDSLRKIISQSSPAIKVPIELMANKNMFFDSPINRGYGHGEPLPGYLQPHRYIAKQLGKEDVELIKASPELRYILDQLTSMNVIGETIEKGGLDRIVHLLNSIGGIKVASYDAEKYRTWALRDRLKELQSY